MARSQTENFSFAVERVEAGQVARFRELNALFATAFDDAVSYPESEPSDAYLDNLLHKPHVIPLVAVINNAVVGGLVAYVLDKFEQERSEIYIYDLAVTEAYRRQGIARALIEELKNIGQKIRAWVIYVQADKDEADLPARKLYESMGEREDVFHYDIEVK